MNMLKITLTTLFLTLSTQAHSFDQCELVLNQAKTQATLASDNLDRVIVSFESAATFHEEGNTALALANINSSETSLHQARNYYVLALFRLDHASHFCSGTQDLEIDQIKGELSLELEELDLYEEKVYELKKQVLNTTL